MVPVLYGIWVHSGVDEMVKRIIYYCDRCGNKIHNYIGEYDIEIPIHRKCGIIEKFNLCEDCKIQLDLVMELYVKCDNITVSKKRR